MFNLVGKTALVTGAGTENVPKAQPSQIIVTKTHYAWVRFRSRRPVSRPGKRRRF